MIYRAFGLLIFFNIALSISLNADDPAFIKAEQAGKKHGREALESSQPEISEQDLKTYVTRLASKQFSGRLTGEPGERMATNYLAEFFAGIGLEPAGDDGSFFDKFPYRSKMVLSGPNTLTIIESETDEQIFEAGDQYQPLPFSPSGKVDSEIVFAGFGIEDEEREYNSFEGLEVEGKWLLVLRGSPESLPKLKQHAPLYRKTALAKQKGAAGIMFFKAKNPNVGSELISPSNSRSSSKPLLPALTITDKLAESLLKQSNQKKKRSLKGIFNSYNNGKRIKGFDLKREAIAEIGLKSQNNPGANVLARLVVGKQPSDKVVIVGGHIDHLGKGSQGGSRSTGEKATLLHPGADDNASGIAAIMEVAQQLVADKKAGNLNLKHDVIFAGWSGEELGLWGSGHFVKEARAANQKQIYPKIATYINLDMVGRLTNAGLHIKGIDSSYDFRDLLDIVPSVDGLEINPIATPFAPTDSESFFYAGVPILTASTGLHDDCHTPDDTIDKINFSGLLKVTKYIKGLLLKVADRQEPVSYVQVRKAPSKEQVAATKILGIRVIPAVEDEEGDGVKIAEVFKGSKSAEAGLQRGDIITSLNKTQPEKIEDFYKIASVLKPGSEYPFSVERDDKKITGSLPMGERLIPFGNFSFNLDLTAPEGLIELTLYMSREAGDSNGEVELGARCLEFPAGQRMIPLEELDHLAKACRSAKNNRPFEKLVETNTYRGVVDTYYRSSKIDDQWQVTIDRDGTVLEIPRKESDYLADAYQQSQAAVAWYNTLLKDQEVTPSRRRRPPTVESFSLNVPVGKEMAENEEIGFKMSIDNLNEDHQLRLSYSLMLGLSANRDDWVQELYAEMGKALTAAETGDDYSATEIGNAVVSANTDKKSVDVVVSVLNRDDRKSSFSRTDYQRVKKLIDKSQRWLDWAVEKESWFHSKP